uniref:Uncharacterized protein n=1 Tax=Tanacetum cinerariifolium TaxID=118510 RepID=A0A6L2J7V1_TANCI|nr:hypothetical protein [Tanacetum cinerariifolium]
MNAEEFNSLVSWSLARLKGLIHPFLYLLLGRFTISNWSITMALSLTYSMPPTRYPPSLQESMATMADNISKLLASQLAFNTQLDIIFKTQAIQLEQTSALISNIAQTLRQNTNTPNVTTPPLKTTTKIDTDSHLSPTVTQIPMIEDDISIKTQTPIPTFPSMPPNLANISPKLQHDISNFYSPTLHKSYDSARFIEEKLATTQVRFSYSNRLSPFKPPKFVFLQPKNKPPWKTAGYKIMSLEDKACFEAMGIDTCMKTTLPQKLKLPFPCFLLCLPNLAYIPPKLQHDMSIFYPPTLHKSYDSAWFIEEKLATTQVRFSYSNRISPFKPPKFVFLQPKNEPPWKPAGCKIMSLEDKACFEAMGIDTCMKVKNKSQVVYNLTTP